MKVVKVVKGDDKKSWYEDFWKWRDQKSREGKKIGIVVSDNYSNALYMYKPLKLSVDLTRSECLKFMERFNRAIDWADVTAEECRKKFPEVLIYWR